jgi:hypothetical protein
MDSVQDDEGRRRTSQAQKIVHLRQGLDLEDIRPGNQDKIGRPRRAQCAVITPASRINEGIFDAAGSGSVQRLPQAACLGRDDGRVLILPSIVPSGGRGLRINIDYRRDVSGSRLDGKPQAGGCFANPALRAQK